jgi:hypothetical protein
MYMKVMPSRAMACVTLLLSSLHADQRHHRLGCPDLPHRLQRIQSTYLCSSGGGCFWIIFRVTIS